MGRHSRYCLQAAAWGPIPLRALSEGWSPEIHDIVGVTKERTPRLEPADAHTLSYQTERL